MQRRDKSPAINDTTSAILQAAIAVHKHLGRACLERAYVVCLREELRAMGRAVMTEVAVPLVYRGVRVEEGFRMDLLVDDMVVVEVKAVERIMPVHVAQLATYLRLAGKPVGLLINFHDEFIRDGTRRVVA